ncbi:MAG: hypothetical protein U9N35_01290 [Euryarchaeota archaeon]|nr:hypothetical protein [Euryarchaeota archaeon]
MKIKKSIDEIQDIKLSVKCPECGRKIRFKEEIDLEEAFDDPNSALDTFESTLFQCRCGNEFFGAETEENELVDDLINIFEEMKGDGKIFYENGKFSLNMGIIEGFKYLKRLKDIGEKYDRGDIFE